MEIEGAWREKRRRKVEKQGRVVELTYGRFEDQRLEGEVLMKQTKTPRVVT